ncbi:MAG: UDP-N-acetylmuramate--L-alanine ligase, partial [Candidatus Cloacimonetes bacterium]|nr:UDP-N-acetylmuramate--L-alanine ligase [Candidatus Cloacimonadota bacterium]
AHHPTEIKVTLKGMRESISQRIIAVFQPHLYSRTNEFHEAFGTSFFQADCLIVTPIYPAREKPIEGVTGKLIADSAIQSGHRNVHYAKTNEEILPLIRSVARKGDLVITMGAGNIYLFGEKLLEK